MKIKVSLTNPRSTRSRTRTNTSNRKYLIFFYLHLRFSFQNDLAHQLDDKLGEAKNFQAWKYNFSLVLKENELDSYISGEVPVLEGDEGKALHKKKLIKAKTIIYDSIKDHLIPQVSSLKTPKEMFDALTKLFEGKNINRKMTLRNQLKNVKI